MDKDKIQEIRNYAEAAANLMPYEDDNVIFSGIEIMELLDHLASKEAEVERLNKEHGKWQTKIEYRLEQDEIRVQRAEAEVKAQQEELGRLREALLEISEWDNGTENEIARRALEGKNIETTARMAYYELTEKLDGEERDGRVRNLVLDKTQIIDYNHFTL